MTEADNLYSYAKFRMQYVGELCPLKPSKSLNLSFASFSTKTSQTHFSTEEQNKTKPLFPQTGVQ